MKDRFCILDSHKDAGIDDVLMQRENIVSEKGYGAVYYPWVKVPVETLSASTNKVTIVEDFVPPSGYVAGIYGRTDMKGGVQKAPANEEVYEALGVGAIIGRSEQDTLTAKGINCIIKFPEGEVRVWGARTLSTDPEWKYIHVRRLLLYLEESIYKGTQWVVFEPNNEGLWAKVKKNIIEFLVGLWKDGAFAGKKPEEAFFVKCDRTTMTHDDIDNGRLICIIGVAPVKPAEFVIFRIAQWAGGSVVTE
jgi:phage tail sheath protein FI